MKVGPMLIAVALLPFALSVEAAQPGMLVLPDFTALTKKATNSVDISLDPSLLSLASGLFSADTNPQDAAVKDLVKGLQGIYVRSYTFAQDDAYSKADVDSVRSQLVAPQWTPLVTTHDLKQHSNVDIFLARSGQRVDGMAIVTSEPRALTIVNIVGSIDLAKLAQLQGHFGIPSFNTPKADSPKE